MDSGCGKLFPVFQYLVGLHFVLWVEVEGRMSLRITALLTVLESGY